MRKATTATVLFGLRKLRAFLLINRVLFLLLAIATTSSTLATAEEGVRGQGPIILTLITDDGRCEFNEQMLRDIGWQTLKTTSDWTEGVARFEGPLMRDVLSAVGIDSDQDDVSIIANALDNYSTIIPLTDFVEFNVVLALRMNGKALTRRDKGPIWIVYPYLDHPSLNTEATNVKWVWQLHELDLRAR